MKTRRRRVFRGGLRFALSAHQLRTTRWDTPAAASQLDDAGNASFGEVSPTVGEPSSSHQPRGSHASRCVSGYAVRRVARDGSRHQVCPTGLYASVLHAKCAWKRLGVTFPADMAGLKSPALPISRSG